MPCARALRAMATPTSGGGRATEGHRAHGWAPPGPPRRRPDPRLLALRLVHVNAGLALFGFSIALQLRAGIGLGPWDVFHTGVALRTPLTVGPAGGGGGVR